MKNKLTLRNVLVCCAFVLALAVFVMSFLAAFRYTYVFMGDRDSTIYNIIWGANRYKDISVVGGTTTISEGTFSKPLDPAAMGLVGTLLVFVGALAALVVSLVLKESKVRKYVLIGCGALVVVGAILTFFTVESFYASYAKSNNMTVQEVKDRLANWNAKVHCALPIIMGILGIVSGGAIVCSQFISNKKLGK